MSATGPTADAYWEALCARDAAFDGRFIYGVVTTGVYCRPSCAARRPKRENVRFYPTPNAARDAGLRPCRRCHPDALAEEHALLERLCEFIDAHAGETITLARLGREAAMSPSRVQRLFTKRLGVSPKTWQDARRTQRLKEGLRGDETGGVIDAIFEAGYGSTSRVYERLDGRIGMTPSAYRAGGAGEEGRNFSFSSREVLDRTAGLTFDLGDGRVESYRVATGSAHNPNTGEPLGISLAYALTQILGFTGEQQIVDGGNGRMEVELLGDDIALIAPGASVEPGRAGGDAGREWHPRFDRWRRR